jgi:hypothetical protein
MIYIVGSRLYGKCDEVKGVFHVATRFGHFDYIPLIPMGSWLVFEKTGNGWRGVRIPLSFKSIFIAWARCIAILAVVIGAIVTFTGYEEFHRGRATADAALGIIVPGTITALSLAFLILSPYLTGIGRASARRAEQLGRLAGLSDQALDALRRKNFDLAPASAFEVLPPTGVEDVSPGR